MLLFSLMMAVSMTAATTDVPWQEDAATGALGRNMGLISWSLCLAAFLLLMWAGGTFEKIRYVYAAGCGAVLGVGILNFMGLDPLCMYGNLVKRQHRTFISTIGNINVYAGFACMAVSVLPAYFYCSKTRRQRLFFGIMSAAAVYAGFGPGCDSFLAGCLGAFVLFLYISLADPVGMKKFWNLCVLFYASALLVELTMLTVKGSDPHFIAALSHKGLYKKMMNPAVFAASGLILALLILLETKLLSKKPELYPKLRRYLFSALLILAAALSIAAVLANMTHIAENTPLLERLVLKDSFAKSRG